MVRFSNGQVLARAIAIVPTICYTIFTTVPFQVRSITNKIKQFQSGGVFLQVRQTDRRAIQSQSYTRITRYLELKK